MQLYFFVYTVKIFYKQRYNKNIPWWLWKETDKKFINISYENWKTFIDRISLVLIQADWKLTLSKLVEIRFGVVEILVIFSILCHSFYFHAFQRRKTTSS